MIKRVKSIVGAVLFSILASQACAAGGESSLTSPAKAGEVRTLSAQFRPEVLAREVVLGAERLFVGLLPAAVHASPSSGAASAPLSASEPESGGAMMFLAALGVIGMIMRRQGSR